jgi:hypothetical protein
MSRADSAAASVLKPKDKKNQGWAVAGATDKPHTLTLLAASPVVVPQGSKLRITLAQNSEFKQHTLGKFRLSFTGDARVQQVTKVPANVVAALSQAERTPAQQKTVVDYYVRNIAKESAAERTRLAAAIKELAAVKPVSVPIMRDLDPKQRRVTKVQLRGNWQALGDEVSEATPAVFNPLPANEPKNRLTMAKWLVSRDNPLTARVTVNRLWESIFGTGIVRSSEEFGSQGDLPVHPELLDWLAAELMDSGWDIKHMLKLMLTSQAYQQSSKSTTRTQRTRSRQPPARPRPALPPHRRAAAGSGARGQRPAFRKMFGVPVRPRHAEPRPQHRLWPQQRLDRQHGRGRAPPQPLHRGAPQQPVCELHHLRRRQSRGLHDPPQPHEHAAAGLRDAERSRFHRNASGDGAAHRLAKPKDVKNVSRMIFKLCLSREPTAHEVTALTQLHAESLATYQKDPAAATKMATEPLGPADKDANLPELAAWTAVANVVMNLDEFLMRR